MLKAQSIIVISLNPDTDLKANLDLDINSATVDVEIYRPVISIGIDVIKEVLTTVFHRPLVKPQKKIVFMDAHKLTLEAQNALLKLLEEPPEFVQIILVAPHLQAFIDTIISRCQIVRLTTTTTTVTSKESTQLSNLISTEPYARLKMMPLDVKTREAALVYCKQLLQEARQALSLSPNRNMLHNLKILGTCHTQLTRNANPTLAVADVLLRLQHGASIATMTEFKV